MKNASACAALKSPAALGYRHPAEWEPHEATWLAWPHNRGDWAGKLSTIPWAYAEIIRKLTPGERARVLVNSAQHKARATRVLTRADVDLARVEFLLIPTDRAWCRDYGPIFLARERPDPGLAIARFRFNAWTRYRAFERDDRVAEEVARRFKLPIFDASQRNGRFVLEGGSVDVNGRGTLITTEQCLLSRGPRARNPGLSRDETETVLRNTLGVTEIVWLARGLAGDDTDGHVDNICRFVDARTVVLCREAHADDPNYRTLEENRERLEEMRLEDGGRPDLVSLPMPRPLTFGGEWLPAGYANFYIANAAVLVPTFNDPSDRVALGILGELIRDRPVIGIHAVDLVLGLGGIHCLTREQPALVPLGS